MFPKTKGEGNIKIQGKKKQTVSQGTSNFKVLCYIAGADCLKGDNTIHWINLFCNHYPVNGVVCFLNTYSVKSDLSGG